MGVLSQALQMIFEMQIKRSNEKLVRKKMSFPIHKMRFFFFFLTPSTFKAFNFLISCYFKQFKVL
jgi:hypothetical protein